MKIHLLSFANEEEHEAAAKQFHCSRIFGSAAELRIDASPGDIVIVPQFNSIRAYLAVVGERVAGRDEPTVYAFIRADGAIVDALAVLAAEVDTLRKERR